MGPFVLILSYGSTKPIEFVQKLQSAKASSNDLSLTQDLQIGDLSYKIHEYYIKNKYFETKVKLLPIDNDSIDIIPEQILKETEAIIIIFDCTDKTILIQLPKLCELVNKNNIELGLLLTTELNDDCNDGLSYADIKEICKNNFDIIETLDKNQGDTSTTIDNQENYSEIIEALENHVWSNVAQSSGDKKQSTSEADEDLDEQQLEDYENLLQNIVHFKSNSANLNRDQLLDQAEKLAEMFSNFMNDD